MDSYTSNAFQSISMDFHGFRWSFMALTGSGARMSPARWHPVVACGILWHPVASCRTGLDPPDIKISDSGGLDLESSCLVVWMLGGLEWIGGGDGGDGGIGMDARWEEGIGRNSHTLELQELGGFIYICIYDLYMYIHTHLYVHNKHVLGIGRVRAQAQPGPASPWRTVSRPGIEVEAVGS